MEAVGVVTAVGPGLTGRKVGDVVAYAGNPMGSYAQEQILPASVAVPVPPSVDHQQAASVMLKGMTAHVLLRRVFKVLRHIDTAKQLVTCPASHLIAMCRLRVATLSWCTRLLGELAHSFVSGHMHLVPLSLGLFPMKRKRLRRPRMDATMS